MAACCVEVDGELIELLKSGSENRNTKRSTDYRKGILKSERKLTVS